MPDEVANGQWAFFTVRASATGAESVRPMWEANLVAGALRDEMHAAGSKGDLFAVSVSLHLPNGETVPNASGGMGNVVFGQRFTAKSPAQADAELRSRIAGAGLDLWELSFLHPRDLAPAVVVRTTDPAQFITSANDVLDSVFAPTDKYEGYYFEADDSQGKPFLIRAVTFRSSVSLNWIRPDLDTHRFGGG